MKKTLVAVNVLTDVDNSIYLSHCQMWYRMGKNFPDDKFFLYTPHRTSIDNCRNFAAKMALEQECDYLLFIDDDMILHDMTYQSLRENIERPGVDVVMALTYIRGYPFHPMFFIDPDRKKSTVDSLDYYDDFEKDVNPETHLVEVDAIGCACVLIKCDLIKKLEPPYFVTTPAHTEDVYFCVKAKRLLGRKGVGIFVDCGVPTGHMGEKAVYSHLTIEQYRNYEEGMNPNIKAFRHLKIGQSPINPDRGSEYLKAIDEPAPSNEAVDKIQEGELV